MQRQWWETFYGEEVGDFVFGNITADQTHREVARVLRSLHLPPHARILDLACGRGRHSIQLAKCGFEVVGLDLSSKYVAQAQLIAKREGVFPRATFVSGDMRNLRTNF